MKVAIVGANGQLGADLVRAFECEGASVIGLTHADLEITNFDSVSQVLRDQRPDVIVNTAAMHQVENCEREPEKAFAVNAIGPRNLARAAREFDAVLMQVSTDYVFDGIQESPYRETDLPRPMNVYGITKLAGEYFVHATTDKHFVVRTSGLYGKQPCRGKGGLQFRGPDAQAGTGAGRGTGGRQRARESYLHRGSGAANRRTEPLRIATAFTTRRQRAVAPGMNSRAKYLPLPIRASTCKSPQRMSFRRRCPGQATRSSKTMP